MRTCDLVMQDMVAFSCCKYDGGEEEKRDMDIVRERSWRGKFRRRGRVIRPGANRIDGKCPLTPLEVSQNLKETQIFSSYFATLISLYSSLL